MMVLGATFVDIMHPEGSIEGTSLLHMIWLWRNHARLPDALEWVKNPTEINLQTAGLVYFRLYDPLFDQAQSPMVKTKRNRGGQSATLHTDDSMSTMIEVHGMINLYNNACILIILRNSQINPELSHDLVYSTPYIFDCWAPHPAWDLSIRKGSSDHIGHQFSENGVILV
jgi:hypothetical protein